MPASALLLGLSAAVRAASLNLLIDERLQAQELAKYEDLVITDEQIDEELAAMAQYMNSGTAVSANVFMLPQLIRPRPLSAVKPPCISR